MGKHFKQTGTFGRKTYIMLLSLALIFSVTVGSTLAFLIATDGPVVNTFLPTDVTPQIEEGFNGSTKSDVTIKNIGETDAYIRAMVVVTWQNDAGEVYSVKPVAGTDYSLTLASGTGWDTQTTDGFYYYTSSVAAGASTGELIDTCTQSQAAPQDGYKLHVEVLAQAIQAKPTSVVADNWGVAVADDGTISK